MKFEETPPYAQMRKLFQKIFMRLPNIDDFKYDWDAMNCEITKVNCNNEHDSNRSNYEDAKDCPKPNMERKIEIKRLTSIICLSPSVKGKSVEGKKNIKFNMQKEGFPIITTGRIEQTYTAPKIRQRRIRKSKSEGKIMEILGKKNCNYFMHDKSMVKRRNPKEVIGNLSEIDITERDYPIGSLIYNNS